MFAAPTASAAYALCAFRAEYTSNHIDYGDENGASWVDSIVFYDQDPIPPAQALEDTFATHIRAGNWSSWNRNYTGEQVDCQISRQGELDEARRNEKEWEDRGKSQGYKVRGIGGLYWWDKRAGRPKDPIIQNNDWRGPTSRP